MVPHHPVPVLLPALFSVQSRVLSRAQQRTASTNPRPRRYCQLRERGKRLRHGMILLATLFLRSGAISSRLGGAKLAWLQLTRRSRQAIRTSQVLIMVGHVREFQDTSPPYLRGDELIQEASVDHAVHGGLGELRHSPSNIQGLENQITVT